MAYEPMKNFRDVIRQILPGDEVTAVGSFKKGSINLEKIKIGTHTRPIISPAGLRPVQQTYDKQRRR